MRTAPQRGVISDPPIALFPCARPDSGPVARSPSERSPSDLGATPGSSCLRARAARRTARRPAGGFGRIHARLVAAAATLLLVLALVGTHATAAAPPSDPAVARAPSGDGAPWLVIRDNGGTELLALPLTDWPRWILRWNHSVTGIRVSDHYAFREGSMMLTASHTPAFDAGLGHIPGRGRQVSDGAGGYWILDLDEPVPGNAYLLRVGPMRVNHRIWHAGRTYSLSELAADSRVKISVETR